MDVGSVMYHAFMNIVLKYYIFICHTTVSHLYSVDALWGES